MSNLKLNNIQITVEYITNQAAKQIQNKTGVEVQVLAIAVNKKKAVDFKEAKNIIEDCCAIWNISSEIVLKYCRGKEIIAMRSLLQHLLKTTTKLSLVDIGMLTGGFHHTSVMHNIDNIKHFLANKDSLINKYFEPIKHFYEPVKI